MADAFFTTGDGTWFEPTELCRGPWDAEACHAGPPAGLMVRSLEAAAPRLRLARVVVEIMLPIPLQGFRVQSEIRRPGRSVTLSDAEILDEDRVYARAYGLHLRALEPPVGVATVEASSPRFEASVPGAFPIRDTVHGLPGFVDAVDVRYDPSGSQGTGGRTVLWMRPQVPLIAGEEMSGFQRICPLADSGNGISYNESLDRVLFLNADLVLSLFREPEGEWHGSSVASHWSPDGTGMSDAELFDVRGPVGRAVQHLLLTPNRDR